MRKNVSIGFSKKLYPLRAIKEAIRHYSGPLAFLLRSNKSYHIVSITFKQEIDSTYVDNFCNDVLFLLKELQ